MSYQIALAQASGFGLGLRHQHFQDVIEGRPAIDWFEVITENFMMPGGNAVVSLTKIRRDYPIVMHGVSLSIGSTDLLNITYLKKLKQTIKRFEPSWVSDHLCWTGVQGKNTHDLLPMPYTKESLHHVVSRVNQVQDYLGHEILLENPSSYVLYKESDYTEWEFLAELTRRSGCYLLLDVNNVYVSAQNHGFDALKYIDSLPREKIKQIHLAGHTQKDNVIIDTHDAAIIEPVFSLYRDTIKRWGPIPTMIERDNNIPPLSELMDELETVKKITNNAILAEKALA